MKIYEIIMQDESNNLYLLGFYRDLKDAVEDINEWLSTYDFELEDDDLKEYPSTFNMCFDLDLGNFSEELCGVYIRGFILEVNDSLDELLEEVG